MNVTDQDVAALTSEARHLMAAKMFSLACCVMLFYDILITFGDEVERIWKQRFNFATILWFMNRYLSPLGYIVIIVSFHDNWNKSVCNRYVLYPEILKIFTSSAIGVIFILRLYSIYGGSMVVLVTFSALLIAELAVKIWAFTDGTSVNLPPGLVGCILTGKSDSDDRFVFTWVAELIFDTIVFLATLSRTLVIYRRHRQGAAIPLIKIMMRDGIVYFLVIFIANVVTVTLFLALPPDLKAVNASFSTLVTSLMVSRLILNLRNQAMRPNAAVMSYPSSQQIPPGDRITSTVIGNLGEPIEANWFDDDDMHKEGFDDEPEGYGTAVGPSRNAYAMQDVYGLSNQRHASTAESVPLPGRIVVEVTRNVTTDVRTRSRAYPYDDREFYQPDDADYTLSRSNSHSQLPPSSTGHSARSTEQHNSREKGNGEAEGSEEESGSRRARRDRDGERGARHAWRPPPTWMLENVELYELGRPRRSGRRPSTS